MDPEQPDYTYKEAGITCLRTLFLYLIMNALCMEFNNYSQYLHKLCKK